MDTPEDTPASRKELLERLRKMVQTVGKIMHRLPSTNRLMDSIVVTREKRFARSPAVMKGKMMDLK